MFALDVPWWELVLRGALVYAVLLFLMRVSGKRTVGQFTPFDLLVLLLLSEGVSNGLSGGDHSLTGALIIATVLVALNYATSVATSRSQRAKRWAEGTPSVIGRNGHLYPEVLRHEKVAVADVEKRLREEGLALPDTCLILLETDGKISFIRASGEQAATPT